MFYTRFTGARGGAQGALAGTSETCFTSSAMRRFEGKSIFVSGAASGIGRATAARFGSEGGRVACADVNLAGAEETAASIRAAGGDAFAIPCDVTSPAAVTEVMAETVRRHAGLHVLANVAGIGFFRRTT